jgi:hypothetical protein
VFCNTDHWRGSKFRAQSSSLTAGDTQLTPNLSPQRESAITAFTRGVTAEGHRWTAIRTCGTRMWCMFSRARLTKICSHDGDEVLAEFDCNRYPPARQIDRRALRRRAFRYSLVAGRDSIPRPAPETIAGASQCFAGFRSLFDQIAGASGCWAPRSWEHFVFPVHSCPQSIPSRSSRTSACRRVRSAAPQVCRKRNCADRIANRPKSQWIFH